MISRLASFAAVAVVTVALCPRIARATRRPVHLIGERALHVAAGAPARIARDVAFDPKWTLPGWERFQRTEGGSWRIIWDKGTLVPYRVYGSGIPARGAVGSAAKAAGYAWTFLQRHLAFLAPGAVLADFVLAANVEHRGVRTVGFHQYYQGQRVLGGQLSFRFKHGRMLAAASEAYPWVVALDVRPAVAEADAAAAAVAWLQGDFGKPGVVRGVDGPHLLPILRQGALATDIEYYRVYAAHVDLRRPRAAFEVYVDAETGEVVARRQLLRFASAEVRFNAPERHPGATRSDYPAPFAQCVIDATPQQNVTADAAGVVTWTGSTVGAVTTQALGTYVQVAHFTGTNATATFPIADAGSATWEASDDELVDAQLSAYIHANRVKTYARTFTGGAPWLDAALVVNVNRTEETCNAYADPNDGTINFFQQDLQCHNTARLADVVIHEFGHLLHLNGIIAGAGSFDSALGEAIGDYLAATIQEDSGMGRGFFRSDAALRELDPPGVELSWPGDISFDPHDTGLIYAGAMWDVRQALIAQMGATAGREHADRLFYASVQRAFDIPATYVETLVEDDDDGDLSNGTPNVCLIKEHFGAHGLTGGQLGGLIVGRPTVNDTEVSIEIRDPGDGCSNSTVTAAAIDWYRRDDPTTAGSVDLTPDGDFYRGQIPSPGDDVVVRYRVRVEVSGGFSRTFPSNPADPDYEIYFGEVYPIFCSDFETDPATQGWTHGLVRGTSTDDDDWTWGSPSAPPTSGDPTDAYSGRGAFGNDLGGMFDNGRYRRDMTNYAETGHIDVSGFDVVRLQYRRWLTVQDAHFDRASIHANGELVWQNLDSNRGDLSDTDHVDEEWRFHDVDLTPHVTAGRVQVRWELTSDRRRSFGGWTLDDVCIVGARPHACGDGVVTSDEECDDGPNNSDSIPDACRTGCRVPICGDGIRDSGEECDDGNTVEGDSCTTTCRKNPKQGCGCAASGDEAPLGLPLLLFVGGLVWLRRRRRARA